MLISRLVLNIIFSRIKYITNLETKQLLLLIHYLMRALELIFVPKLILSVLVYFYCSNLTDVAYQSNMSRLKYTDINNVTGRTGVYNMGRNFSIKLLIPIGIKN